ncbi:MAG: ubiquitin-like domain-containing protein [Phototrophicaceae bacterium]
MQSPPTLPHRYPKKTRPLSIPFLVAFLTLCISFVLIVLVVSSLSLWALLRTQTVTVRIDGDLREVTTRADTVQAVLDELQINLAEGDRVSLPLYSVIGEGQSIDIDLARNVIVTFGSETLVIRTPLTLPLPILNSLGIFPQSDDYIRIDNTVTDLANLANWSVPVHEVVVRKAVNVQVLDGQESRSVRTTAPSVGDLLFELGIPLYASDMLTPQSDSPLSDGLTITILRSKVVNIRADGTTFTLRTHAPTVGDALADAHLTLLGLDYVFPTQQTPLQSDATIEVIRVRETILSENAIVPYERLSEPNETLELDQVQVLQEGRNGQLRKDIRVRYENEQEVARQDLGESLVQMPQTERVAYGTGIVLRAVDTPEGQFQYWRKVRLYATSYHPAALGGDNITATGRVLTKGVVGADPTLLPYGSQIYVPGYGVGLVADTGPSRGSSLWVDLGYDDANWVSWSRWTDVYLLLPIPNNIPFVLPN